MKFSQSEENYLKAIYKLSIETNQSIIHTNLIAQKMNTKASSVTSMFKKLAEKDLLIYQKYKGVELTKTGKLVALKIVRKHRLWECFLLEKLNFNWDEIHDIAEQLEHIQSKELVNRLDKFLEYPTHDPHGDPIPDKNGIVVHHKNIMLSTIEINKECIIIGLKDSSIQFLKYLEKIKIKLGSVLKVVSKEVFDNSLTIEYNNRKLNISNQIAKNLYVK